MRNETDGSVELERERSQRAVQLTMALLSLGSLLFGLVVHLMAERLGLPAETARLVASAFLLAATLDACVLLYWERLFPAAR